MSDDRSLMNAGALADLARRAVGTEVETLKRMREGDVPFVVVDKGRELRSAAGLVDEFERTPSLRIMKHKLSRDPQDGWDRLAGA